MKMDSVNTKLERIHEILHEDSQNEVLQMLTTPTLNTSDTTERFNQLKTFLDRLLCEINDFVGDIKAEKNILISVKHQKLLQTCFQLITSLGISTSLLPGVGISMTKRCMSATVLSQQNFTDEQKYSLLTECTDFFTKCYEIPVLRNIILTFHLSDYLAALLQLSFAPLKKPGSYSDFIMTEELFGKLACDKKKYTQIYNELVGNCFQPTLMKELLVLQSVCNPSPPMFIKRVISKEMSQRLLVPGGLLSLIRCFVESYSVDTGLDWKKVDMICKIVTAKHGSNSEDAYLSNISTQLKDILVSNNAHYLATAVSCLVSLNEKYPNNKSVLNLTQYVYHCLDYNILSSEPSLPGTIIQTPQEIEHNINIIHACVCTKLEVPKTLLLPNLYMLFLLGLKCTKNEALKTKLLDIVTKCLEQFDSDVIVKLLECFLFGKSKTGRTCISVEEFDAGLALKNSCNEDEHPIEDAVKYTLNIFYTSSDDKFIQNMFAAALQLLIVLNDKRQTTGKTETLEDPIPLISEINAQYGIVLQLLTEVSASPKIISTLKTSPSIVLPFIENFIMKCLSGSNDECVTISLILLNTILSNSSNIENIKPKLNNLIPLLLKQSVDESNLNSILCKEALTLISSENPEKVSVETPCGKAIADIFDGLLPVRAHGIIQLTKLIDSKDPETISKKHYILCLFQEQLKDADSYIYLGAVNGIAALGTHCPEDVLQVLCKEFLHISSDKNSVATGEDENKISELRMKVGDIIVKVTKNLGEMSIKYKTMLLNTVLCGCRDEDPLIRTSALSNLAEIALVLHYRIGTIIYEVLLCIESIIETDKAVECRRGAVMVISSLLRGLGKETLVQLKDNLLPIYRTLKKLYINPEEDSVVRLHAQLALEELNATVNELLFPELKIEKQIFVLDKPENAIKYKQ